jgi:hypothetical protein
MALCRCTCGKLKPVEYGNLRSGISRSCLSCGLRRRAPYGKQEASVSVGDRFGRLTVLEIGLKLPPSPSQSVHGRSGKPALLCRCDCGTVRIFNFQSVFRGDSRSCGCLASESKRQVSVTHGLSKHPLYSLHQGMMRRCYNPSFSEYHNYGGRGIAVADEWHCLAAFVTWIESNLGPRPAGYSLDRIDNNGNYEPGNVRWANKSQQNRNRRRLRGLSEDELAVVTAMRSGRSVAFR